MNNTANTLRTLVMENALTLGHLTRDQLGEDYAPMTKLYTSALDALTHWASKDYAHTSADADKDAAFAAIKAILACYQTDEDRIIIDNTSLRTMRDCATKPQRQYSDEYKAAAKALKTQLKTVDERYSDLLTLGCPEREEDETMDAYVERINDLGINTIAGTGKTALNMLDCYVNACAFLEVKAKAVKDVKAAGNWTWRRPVAVKLAEFADLVENYIADCLMDGYNIKPSKQVRDEASAARKAKAEAKAN